MGEQKPALVAPVPPPPAPATPPPAAASAKPAGLIQDAEHAHPEVKMIEDEAHAHPEMKGTTASSTSETKVPPEDDNLPGPDDAVKGM